MRFGVGRKASCFDRNRARRLFPIDRVPPFLAELSVACIRKFRRFGSKKREELFQLTTLFKMFIGRIHLPLWRVGRAPGSLSECPGKCVGTDLWEQGGGEGCRETGDIGDCPDRRAVYVGYFRLTPKTSLKLRFPVVFRENRRRGGFVGKLGQN